MAVRIANINLALNKRIEIALTSIYGVGRSVSRSVLKKAGISNDKKTSELTEDEISKIRTIVEKELVIEGELKRDIQSGIKRLKDIGCYRGTRHTKNLPARGQRTKTNARTRKGPRRTMGSGKKPKGQKT